jgi:glycerol-3-phosphate dehydrogenase
VEGGRATTIVVGDGKDQRTISPEVVVNAAGAWSGRVAAMASLDLPVQMDRGSMVVFNGRVVNGLVNRLRAPSDGDILVPHRTSTILGTTSGPGEIGNVAPRRDEVVKLVQEAREILPGIGEARMVRAYTGVRPLIAGLGTGRAAPRGFMVIHHAPVDNFVSVVGGKLTTYRLMAERAADDVMSMLGRKGACRTAVEDLLPPAGGSPTSFHHRVAQGKYGGLADEMLATAPPAERAEACSCEAVSFVELEHFMLDGDVRDLGDLMRRTRAGMGYCQAGLCAYRMTSVLEGDPIAQARTFLRARWKGIEPVLEGQQLQQEAFKAHLFRVYGIDHSSGGSQ